MREHVNHCGRGRGGESGVERKYANIPSACASALACIRVNMCVCMHVMTDRVGVLMLKWSTHPDRLALLQPFDSN